MFGGNDRRDREHRIAQLAGGGRALTAPVDSWVGNGADMVLTSRAWTLKAGSALLPPIAPRHRELHEAARPTWRRRGFQTLVNEVLKVRSSSVCTSRRTHRGSRPS